MYRPKLRVLLISTMAVFGSRITCAQDDLANLDLAALMQMDVNVTTATRSEQSIYSVAAPIFVVTAEDIRRAGASSIPEAIRLAPGAVVEQIDPGKWIVSLRGFAWQYANKALILLDGRAVYSPLNSSVYWNTLDVPMEDIERIEVIRGPGDARWGSHAVNGIINIITRAAVDERGSTLSAELNSDAGRTVTARHGGPMGANVSYRAYAKYLEDGSFASRLDGTQFGGRSAVRAGVRLDGTRSNGDRISVIAELQDGSDRSSIQGARSQLVHYDANEWSTLARWERTGSHGLEQQMQLSFDRLEQRYYEERDTVDFSYQARFAPLGVQTFTLGATYKRSTDHLSLAMPVTPRSMTQETHGMFVHDSVALGARTRLQLGSQFEHNRFTGWEIQPNAQLLYTPGERQGYWASVSRAVRTPVRVEDGFALEYPLFENGLARASGNTDLKSEEVLAWQVGARRGISEHLFVDVTAFYNAYDNLVLREAGTPFFEAQPAPGRVISPNRYGNPLSGHTTGVELAVAAQPLDGWNLSGSVSIYSQTAWRDPLGYGSVTAVNEQFQLHSSTKLFTSLQWSADFYYAGASTAGDVPAYSRFDSQLAWLPPGGFEAALGVRNAFKSEHVEAGANGVDTATLVPRMAYLRFQRKF